MQFDWVRTFVAVADHQSFSAAASALHCSQPRVSSHIRALEQSLHAQLLDRTQRPVELTDAGVAFLPHARAMLSEVDASRSSVGSVTGLQRGEVRLGSYPSASAGFLPALLTSFAEEYPGIRVHLLELSSLELEDALVEGRVELLLRPCRPPMSAPHVQSKLLWREPLVAVVPAGHPLLDAPRPLPVTALLDYPIIMNGRRLEGRGGSFETHATVQRAARPAHVAYEITQPQTLVSLVCGGHGVGITNLLGLQVSNTEGVRRIELADDRAVREVAMYWLPDRMRSYATRALWDKIAGADVPAGAHPPST
ncbi:MAG: LysR family transcriptional regulator [Pseudonocardiaceae bacterium]|nr:LysR family transcriptional regulator [Pseudonocardiaceae bacterium]